MSGKAWGKKRNRAAQSEQHGYQQDPEDKAVGTEKGEAATHSERERQRVQEKMRKREEDRRRKAGEEGSGEESTEAEERRPG